MKNITISKLIRSSGLSSMLCVISFIAFAQTNESTINHELKQQSFYQGLSSVYYVAVSPVNGCFTCVIMLSNQIRSICKKNKIVIVYPSTRKVLQEKIKKENALNQNNAIYIFDDNLYQKFHDDKKPKGYTLKVKKH